MENSSTVETQPNEVVSALLDQEPDAPAPEAEKPTPEPESPQPEEAATPETPAEVEEEKSPETLKEYAERTGVKLEDLYGLTTSSGKTLSELSDRAKDFENLEVSATEFEREQAEFRVRQAEFNQAIVDWAELVKQGQATPEALVQLNEQRKGQAERAGLATLELIPEWKDPGVRAADAERIESFVTRFGVKGFNMDSLTDPNVKLMMKYVIGLESRFQDALGKVRKAKNKTPRAPGKPSQPQAKTTGLNPVATALAAGLNKGL